MLAYLTLASPYHNWHLTVVELGAHSVHALMLIIAMGLVLPASISSGGGETSSSSAAASASLTEGNWCLVALLVLIVVMVLVFEGWQLVRHLIEGWHWCKKALAERSERRRKKREEEEEAGRAGGGGEP